MSGTYPAQASSLRVGGYIVIRDRPCKIIKMTTSKTGKHGHAKINYTATDIFNGNKLEYIEASTHNVDVPNVTKNEYTLIDIDDGYLNLMNETGEMKEDIKLGESELAQEISALFDEGKELQIIIQSAMGMQEPVSFKIAKN
jgi:translation initiation factor 5A